MQLRPGGRKTAPEHVCVCVYTCMYVYICIHHPMTKEEPPAKFPAHGWRNLHHEFFLSLSLSLTLTTCVTLCVQRGRHSLFLLPTSFGTTCVFTPKCAIPDDVARHVPTRTSPVAFLSLSLFLSLSYTHTHTHTHTHKHNVHHSNVPTKKKRTMCHKIRTHTRTHDTHQYNVPTRRILPPRFLMRLSQHP